MELIWTGTMKAEQEVRASESRKSGILETALDCIITMDHEGKVIDFNPAAELTFVYSRGDVIGRELADLIIPPSLRERHQQGMARYLVPEKARSSPAASTTSPACGRQRIPRRAVDA